VSVAPKPESQSRFQPQRLAAVCVAAIWLCALIWLVASSANPVTVNRTQVTSAARRGVVISGMVVDEVAGRVKVVEVLAQEAEPTQPVAPGDEILVGELSRSGGHRAEQRYLLPLGRRGTAYEVMPTNLPGGTPLIYPDNDEARQQFADVLGARPNAAAL
jgi:hypothetical protein